ncbi:hypothetical protein THIOM_003862 [Candidatus Thiomargarita nelsonii]|uniref:Uncharacterized protein n=1 Tax=Candidatus Thiomargarita nelsonii TaxID=1003181 RepID=A0A176RXB0_9GAMM|nr:hypothetical protein THIOM_003862 [Candidatus Thiomargarita nelsonii]
MSLLPLQNVPFTVTKCPFYCYKMSLLSFQTSCRSKPQIMPKKVLKRFIKRY